MRRITAIGLAVVFAAGVVGCNPGSSSGSSSGGMDANQKKEYGDTMRSKAASAGAKDGK